jgi:nitrite reductase/ring-hydroxylating ferredoxin subunit
LRGRIVRERLEEYYDHENMVVACPWHGWEFDLRSGVCLADPGRRVACYETVVQDGQVSVVLPEGD